MNKKNFIKFIKKTGAGFTLIELLIYLAIVAVVVNTLVIFALNLISLGAKSSRQQEVYSAATILASKIKYEIRNAADISIGSSDFGLNLVENPGKKLSLAESGAGNPVVFDVLDGNARISRGGSAPVTLNSAGGEITDLTFTNLSSGSGSTKQLKFTLTVTAVDPSPGNIYENTSLESSAELRSHD